MSLVSAIFPRRGSERGSVGEFLVTDADGGADDIGRVRYIKERKSSPTSKVRADLEQICVMFEIVGSSLPYRGLYRYLVAVGHSDRPIREFDVGDFFDSKVISLFADRKDADEAYGEYGPEYLRGVRAQWSQISRIK